MLRLIVSLGLLVTFTAALSVDIHKLIVYGPNQLKIGSDLLQGKVKVGNATNNAKKGQFYDAANLNKVIQAFLHKLDQDEANQQRLFAEFKKMYSKVYPSLGNELYSQGLFVERLKMVLENNIKALFKQSSYVMALHSKSDKPLDYIMQYTSAGNWPNASIFLNSIANESSYANSFVFDQYRAHHQVGKIVNQGGCGACVYFAAAAAIESFWARKGHSLVTLSTQQLNDCARDEKHGNHGCQHGGGTFVPTFNYIKKHGLTSWDNYPYIAKDAECKRDKESQVTAKISDWHPVLPHANEDALKQALEKQGPIAVAIHFNDALAHYKHGNFDGNCKGGRNHAILLVGYGHDASVNQDYWILKNQWGEHYGEHGYFRLRRNHGNMCDVAGDAVYVV